MDCENNGFLERMVYQKVEIYADIKIWLKTLNFTKICLNELRFYFVKFFSQSII